MNVRLSRKSLFFSETSGELRDILSCRALSAGPRGANAAHAGLNPMLATIGRVLGLNTTLLAEVCGLRSWKSLIAWTPGTGPGDSSTRRVHLLYRAALDWSRSGFACPENCLHQPIMQGITLHDLLTADPLDLEALHFAGARTSLQGNARASLAANQPVAEE